MKIVAADLFCGAGGTSTGMVEACDELGHKLELTAINHWDVAIATHSLNHPKARHLCTSLDVVDPRKLYREGELDILWASPECTHHSNARGGKPMSDQSRATAWCVVRWAEALRPAVILVENVREFSEWGPIGTNGRPLKSGKGKVFYAWKAAFEAIGYRVEFRTLCAADYGDPTTRRRLFVFAVLGRRKIVWPEPSHAETDGRDMFEDRKPWRSAREIIDWTIPGRSIYGRKKPLAAKTLNRIRIGLEKFGLHPSIVCMEHGGAVRSASRPLPTITTAKGGAMGIATPYLVVLRNHSAAGSLDKPTPTITAGGKSLGLCEPFLVQTNHGNGDNPKADSNRVRSMDTPLPTVAGNRGEWALLTPFLLGQQSCAQARSVDEPVPTVATAGAISLCAPFLVEYYGTGTARSVDTPMATIATHDRFGLVQPMVAVDGHMYRLDVRFRMLKPMELARAQGFPGNYQFAGTATNVVKQIGNAVPKNLSKALMHAALRAL